MPQTTEHISCYYCSVKENSVFNFCNEAELKTIGILKSCILFKKGEQIFKESDLPKFLYCINKGTAKLSRLNQDGKEQILHLAKGGDIMGYRAILSGDTFSCSAIAIEDTIVCTIPKKNFISLVENNSKLAFKMIELFSKKLKDVEKGMATMRHSTVKERVCASLLMLKENYGFEEDGLTINTKLSRETLANLSGTTRETATRTLFELQNENILELADKKIKIINIKTLIQISKVED